MHGNQQWFFKECIVYHHCKESVICSNHHWHHQFTDSFQVFYTTLFWYIQPIERCVVPFQKSLLWAFFGGFISSGCIAASFLNQIYGIDECIKNDFHMEIKYQSWYVKNIAMFHVLITDCSNLSYIVVIGMGSPLSDCNKFAFLDINTNKFVVK